MKLLGVLCVDLLRLYIMRRAIKTTGLEGHWMHSHYEPNYSKMGYFFNVGSVPIQR
jgi:hypothetical protein